MHLLASVYSLECIVPRRNVWIGNHMKAVSPAMYVPAGALKYFCWAIGTRFRCLFAYNTYVLSFGHVEVNILTP